MNPIISTKLFTRCKVITRSAIPIFLSFFYLFMNFTVIFNLISLKLRYLVLLLFSWILLTAEHLRCNYSSSECGLDQFCNKNTNITLHYLLYGFQGRIRHAMSNYSKNLHSFLLIHDAPSRTFPICNKYLIFHNLFTQSS